MKITVVDVSDLSNLRVTHEYKLPGHYNSARKVGSSVRMVISDDFNFPASVRWWPEVQGVNLWEPINKGRRTDEFNKLIVANELQAFKIGYFQCGTGRRDSLTAFGEAVAEGFDDLLPVALDVLT